MLDISDGLVSDLFHILEESRCGAELWESAIPVSDAARAMPDGLPPLRHALHDGEDFELLFTVPPESGELLVRSNPLSIPLTRIGTVTPASGCRLLTTDGQSCPLTAEGWQHTW